MEVACTQPARGTEQLHRHVLGSSRGGKEAQGAKADVAKINAETPALAEKGTHHGQTAQGMETYGPLIATAVLSLNTGCGFAAQRCTRRWSKWQ